MSDLSSLTLSDYYFAIVSNDNTDLMIGLGNGVNNTDNHALFYQNAADPKYIQPSLSIIKIETFGHMLAVSNKFDGNTVELNGETMMEGDGTDVASRRGDFWDDEE